MVKNTKEPTCNGMATKDSKVFINIPIIERRYLKCFRKLYAVKRIDDMTGHVPYAKQYIWLKIHSLTLLIRCFHTRWPKGWMDSDTFSTCHSWCFVCIACLFAIDYILLDSATESDDGPICRYNGPFNPVLFISLPLVSFLSLSFSLSISFSSHESLLT